MAIIIAKNTRSSLPVEFKISTNGILLFFDNTRNKWLSSNREILNYSIDHKNVTNNRWVGLTGGVTSNNSGYKLIRNSTITGVSVQTKTNTTCSFEIKKNNDPTIIYSIDLFNESNKVYDDLDLTLVSGDYIQLSLNINSGLVSYLVINIEYAQTE